MPDAAVQVAWGRCVAALGGAPVSFALHASPDAPAAAAALRAAGALFVAQGDVAPPLAGCSAAGWPAAASVEDESAPLPARLRRRREADAQLVLTACALPAGVRAGLFQGDTTSVPDLPDLAGALTSRPPHLVVLSHAQFDVPSLLDRLEALLPASGAAAAIALPVDGPRGEESDNGSGNDRERVTPRNLASPQQPQPQVCAGGAAQPRPGFVGVALSREAPPGGAKDTGSPPALPMSVPDFTALARALLGSFRAKAWTFSAAVQTALFLPGGGNVPLAAPSPPEAALAAALYPEGTAGRLPLFELDDLVMLPGGREELLIFEPRYRLMVRAALEATAAAAASGAPVPPPGALFGVVSRGVGVTAALGGYKLEPTGKAHVVVRGGRRFRVTLPSSLTQPMATFGLSVADVTYFDDVPPDEDSEGVAALEAAAMAALAALRSALDEASNLAKEPLPRAAAALAAVAAHAPASAGGDGDLEAMSWELAALLPGGQERARAWRDVTCTRLRLEDQANLLMTRRRVVAGDFARNLRE